MADTVLVKLGFEFDNTGIKRARQAVERALSGLKIDIDPNVKSLAGGGAGGVVGATGQFQGEIARLNKQAAATQKKLISAQERRNATAERISQLEVKGKTDAIGLNKKQRDELAKLNRSLRSQKGAVTKLESKFSESVAAAEILETALRGATNAYISLASGGVQIVDDIRNAGAQIKAMRRAGIEFVKSNEAVTKLLIDQRASVAQQVRVSEESFRANSIVAEELRQRARKIVDEGLAAGTLTEAQEKMAQVLVGQANSVENASRPIRAVAERAAELSIRFGAAGRVLTEALGVTRQELAAAANKFGGNIAGVVSEFQAGGTEEEQEERARLVNLANAATRAEIQSETELVKANRDLAASQQARAKDRSGQITGAEKAVVEAFKEFARDSLEAGKTFEQTVDESSGFIGANLESTGRAVRSIFLQGAKEAAQGLVRQTSATDRRLIDTTDIQATIDAEADELQSAFGITAIEATKLLDPLREKLEQVKFKELESNLVEEAREFARELAASGIKFSDRITDVETRFQDFPAAIDAFRNEFGKAKDLLVKGVTDSAKAAGQLDVGKFTQELEEGFGVAAQEARLIAAKVEKQVETARINRAAKDFANDLLSQGETFEAAVASFEQDFGTLTTGSLRQIRNAFNTGAKDFLRAMLQKAKDINNQIDVVQIRDQLIDRFGLGTGDAEVAIERFDRDLQEVRKKAVDKANEDAARQAALQTELQNLQQQQVEANKRLLESINDAIKNKDETGKQILTSDIGGGGSGGKIGAVQTLADINRLAKQLDSKSLARFVTLLREEDANLKKVNASLKNHQGNIAKSNNLVDQLTVDMNAGQKAAFQFGFAASSAAERLAAWASPAALLFTATQLLREAVTEIVRLDKEAASLAFFQPRILDDIAAGIDGLAESTTELGDVAGGTADAFNELNSILEKQNVITAASSQLQDALIDRVKQTGIQLQTLTEISRTAGRVGRDAFTRSSESGELIASAFQQGIETLARFEGENFNAEKAVANLNSAINIFGENIERTPVLVARLAEAANNAGLSAGELLETVVRSGPAFRELGVASFTESLTLAAAATQKVIPSASQLGTLLKQLNVNADGARDAIQEFSGIDIAGEDNLITLPELLTGLAEIEKLSGSAKVAFAEAFSDKRVRAGLLGIAQVAGDVAEELEGIQDPSERAATAGQALSRVYAATNVESRTLSRELEKLSGGLQEVVKNSGALEIPTFFVRGLSGAVELGQTISEMSNGLINLKTTFAALAGAALPVLQKIVAGFRAGFLQNQISLTAIQGINEGLGKELGLAKAVAEAEKQGLISTQSVAKARALIVQELVNVPILQREVATIEKQIALLEKDRAANQRQIQALKGQQLNLERQILNTLEKERKLAREIKTEVNETAASTSKKLASRFGSTIGFVAAGAIGQAIVSGVTSTIEDKKTSSLVGTALQGALTGAGTGFIIGGGLPGAIAGAVAGAGAGLLTAYTEANNEAAKLAEQTAEIARQQELASDITQEEAAFREQAAAKISAAQAEAVRLQSELLDIDNEIRRVGEERARQLDLITKRAEIAVELRKAALAAGKEQEKNLRAQEELQRKLVVVALERARIEKAIGIVRSAELNAIRRDSNRGSLEIEIGFKFDVARIEAQRRELEDRLSEIAIEGSQTSTTEKRRVALAKEEEKTKRQIVNLEFTLLQKQIDAQKALLDAAEESANKQIDAWAKASSSVVEAFTTAVDLQSGIADVIRQEGEIINSILDNQLSQAQGLLSLGTLDILDDGVLIELPKAVRNAVAGAAGEFPGQPDDRRAERLAFLQRQFTAAQTANIERAARAAREVREEPVLGAGEILKEAEGLASAIADANLGLGEFTGELTPAQRQLAAELDAQSNALAAQANARQNLIDQENDISNELISAKENEIKSIEGVIKAQNERAQKDIKTADRLVNNTDEFLKDFAKQLTAESFLEDIDFSGGLEGALGEITRRVGRIRGDRGVVSDVLAGIENAIQSGQSLQEGVSNQQLLTVVSRLLLGRSQDDIKKFIEEQKNGVTEIVKLQNEINALQAKQAEMTSLQSDLIKANKTVADQQRTIDEGARKELEAIVAKQVENARQLEEKFNQNQEKIKELQGELSRILGGGFTQVSDKLLTVDDSVEKVRKILEDIAGADEGVSGFRKLRDELKNLLKGRGIGAVDEEARDELLNKSFDEIAKVARQDESRRGERAVGIGPGLLFGAFGEEIKKTGEGIQQAFTKLAVDLESQGLLGQIGSRLAAGEDVGEFTPGDFQDIASRFGISTNELIRALDAFDPTTAISSDRVLRSALGILQSGEQGTTRNDALAALTEGLLGEGRRALSGIFDKEIVGQRLDELRDALPQTAIDDVNRNIEEGNARTKLQQDANDTQAELLKDARQTKETLALILAAIEQTGASGATQESIDAVANLVKLLEDRRQADIAAGRTPTAPKLKIDEESLAEFKNLFTQAFTESSSKFRDEFKEALRDPLNVNFSDLAVNLNARVLQELRGGDFVEELREIFRGTGLEDKVELIQNVLFPIAQTEVSRGNPNIPEGALDDLSPPGPPGPR